MSHMLQRAGFLCARDKCADIAERWLTACSDNSCGYGLDRLAQFTDEQLAEKCIFSWGLDQPQDDDNNITWFEANGANPVMLSQAFAELRGALTKGIADV